MGLCSLPPLIFTVDPFVDVPTIVYSVLGSLHVQFPDPMLYTADFEPAAICPELLIAPAVLTAILVFWK